MPEQIPAYSKALCLDLETDIDGSRIYKIAAWRADTTQSEVFKGSFSWDEVQRKLDALASGATIVLGHNILQHDLPLLRQHCPLLALLSLPAVDTLLLSPIAYPENPYHHLVKDYKLLRDSLNDPLADAKLAWSLFEEQRQALEKAPIDELLCHHYLLTGSDPKQALANLFVRIRRKLRRPSDTETQEALTHLIQHKVCTTRLNQLQQQDLRDPAQFLPIAYTLAWLRVSGGNSVLPAWVAQQYPATRQLIRELRDQPCLQLDCAYCQTTHDPQTQLQRYFGFDAFRNEPTNAQGGSLQADIVSAGMRNEHLLAILPTGGGKSLCYQLPALNRYWRNGSLTIIISPLQSLMKDQVDNLVQRGITTCAGALNGLLNVIERREVLEKIRLGDIGILLVSPEQLRNKSFREAIHYRQIGAWVFDEAHCLSKWGQDFRPDYWYAARFIREQHGDELPQIACFTATAKLEVIEDLRSHFKTELGIELRLFSGGHERDNLHYQVINTTSPAKPALIHQILENELRENSGGAVVFTAKRKSAEEIASFLTEMGWHCRYFHAGLLPEEKKLVQQAFIAGALQVIVATNAFGMGVDKADVRVVVHAEIPGSLENYLQEAGRAGRDQRNAHCVLLYDEQDVEVQFGLAARSQLSRKDISEILRVLRKHAKKAKQSTIVLTAGEILADEEQESAIQADRSDADTRVKTALSWLERAELLQRNENETRIFPASLKIPSLSEAEQILKNHNLSTETFKTYRTIVELLINADSTEGISTDELMLQTGKSSDECVRVLQQMEQMGILSNDLEITIRLRKGVADTSQERLEQHTRIEAVLLDLLPELAPDADSDTWQALNLRELCQGVKNRAERDVLPEMLLSLLRTMSQPFGNTEAERPALELKKISREQYQVKLRRTWASIRTFSEKRQAAAQSLLTYLLDKVGTNRGADLSVSTKAGELCAHLRNDISLAGLIQDEAKALEHGLLYLDRTQAIQLDRGRTVFRSAMTLKILDDENRRGFRQDDYVGLKEYYQERTFQIHVMQEYARLGLEKVQLALAFIAAYFREPKGNFIKRYFADRKEVLELATTGESLQRIVHDLRHRLQQRLVTDKSDANHLILAGPGSGKTRVIVHRVAYLLQVLRIPAEGIIVLTFNRQAAYEVRKRLLALVHERGYGVTVLTYHAMAMRLTGTSYRGLSEAGATPDLDALIPQATALLRSQRQDEEGDELRDQLLRGYRYILVDEYQDIDADQYELISALSGRTLNDSDAKLTIMAVGDDDQHIYGFRKTTSNQFIQRFQQEYKAEIHYLVENYRSSAHIIQISNQLITAVSQRLKQAHPIVINTARKHAPAGGIWESRDVLARGRVHLISCPADTNIQAQMVMAEIQRLRTLADKPAWSEFAVLARSHAMLHAVRAYCLGQSIPCWQAGDKPFSLYQLREGQQLIRLLTKRHQIHLPALERWASLRCKHQPNNPWQRMVQQCIIAFRATWPMDNAPSSPLLDSVYEFGDEQQAVVSDKLTLSTVHAAKGREFTHVALLDGDWTEASDDETRLYYVGMTRAKETLTLMAFHPPSNPHSRHLPEQPSLWRETNANIPPHDPALDIRFIELKLKDVFMDFAGRQPANAQTHKAIADLKIGETIQLVGRTLRNLENVQIGLLAKDFILPVGEIIAVQVHAIVTRNEKQTALEYRSLLQVEQWETVLCSLTIQTNASRTASVPTKTRHHA